MANQYTTIKISPRERLTLAFFLSQTTKAKGPIEERALLAAFDEFGLTPLLPELDRTSLWGASETREDTTVSPSSLKLVLDALNNPDAPKAPLQVLILRPLADALAQAGNS